MNSPIPAIEAPSRHHSVRLPHGGVAIAHLPHEDRQFLGSPSVARREEDGALLASFDVFGADSTSSHQLVYESTDAGESWHPLGEVADAFWSTLFVHRGALYLLGCTSEYGALVIRRSDDGGRTWSQPEGPETGLLRSDARFHTAAVPVVSHRGRLWRSIEINRGVGQEWGCFAASVMSASEDDDLLNAASWTITPPLDVPPDVREAGCPTWLEGNVLVTADGDLVNLLRAEVWDRGHQVAAMLSVGAPGEPLVAGSDALMSMPGGGSKFTARFDATSGDYFALVNTALYDASPTLGLRARNTLSLARSADGRSWRVVGVIAHHPDDARCGYQYADWIADGDDLLAVVRTASEFAGKNAASFHDSNLVSFHRVAQFRRFGAAPA